MRNLSFIIRKWGIRAMLAAGAAIGLSSCTHRLGPNPAEGVYGPPPGSSDSTRRVIKVLEDVYGPPVENVDSID